MVSSGCAGRGRTRTTGTEAEVGPECRGMGTGTGRAKDTEGFTSGIPSKCSASAELSLERSDNDSARTLGGQRSGLKVRNVG